jgi:hypothetical protein
MSVLQAQNLQLPFLAGSLARRPVLRPTDDRWIMTRLADFCERLPSSMTLHKGELLEDARMSTNVIGAQTKFHCILRLKNERQYRMVDCQKDGDLHRQICLRGKGAHLGPRLWQIMRIK